MLPISRPTFDEQDINAIVAPLRAGWVVQGERVRTFETRMAAFTGATHGIATSSGTTALHLALSALEIGAGHEVIVPAFTWIATANAVKHTGATPVFVDISLDDFNIDAHAIERAITPRTRAIMPVHQFGLPADMRTILHIAARHKLFVVEDAACGFGATYEGQHVGSLGDAGCFSFHPRKAITTGEGGMVVTNRDDVGARCRSLRDHGADPRDAELPSYLLPEFSSCGFNYRMTDIQGALGCSQLAKASDILRARRTIASQYDAMLASCSWLRRPAHLPDRKHAYQSYVCLFAPEQPSLHNMAPLNTRRNAIMSSLERRGIGTRQGTHSLPHTRCYRADAANSSAVGEDVFGASLMAANLSIALPLFPGMTPADVQCVTDALQQAFAESAAA